MALVSKQVTNNDYNKNQVNELVLDVLDALDMDKGMLNELPTMHPYLILDGHRSGVNSAQNEFEGYIEGAKFSLRYAQIMKLIGGQKATFLIHTLRNYKTMNRMNSIFAAIKTVGKKFIKGAMEENIKLKYYGKDVHSSYAMADLINMAEKHTKNNNGFDLRFLTNYSEQWGMEYQDKIADIPEINVVTRFTKGHYSGATVVGKQNAANFMSVQQASIDKNWNDEEIVVLILSQLKSYLALKGYVGGKTYNEEEKNEIYKAREEESWMGTHMLDLGGDKTKSIMSFEPRGPVQIRFRV